MGPKKASASGSSGEKRKKVMLSLELKQEIIEKHERGVRVSDMAKQYDLNDYKAKGSHQICQTIQG